MGDMIDNARGGCVLAGLNSSLSAIKGVCPIFHSGPGCCMQSSAAEQSMSGGKLIAPFTGNAIPCTNMQEKDVVFGGISKLETTVRGAIEVIEADAYFIVVGCTAGIIGDDVESVVETFQNEGYPVYAIETPGFYGDSYLGYEEAWKFLVNNLVVSTEKDPRLVNLFGIIPYHDPLWSGNLEEISRILKRLGLKVNTFYTENQTIENVKNSSAASLNIVVHPWLLKEVTDIYEEKYGVPVLRVEGLPIGATDTSNFVRMVARKLCMDEKLVEHVIAEEEEYVYSYLEQIVAARSWERFGIVGDSNMAIGLTRYLANDMSFTPKYVVVYDGTLSVSEKESLQNELTNLEYAKVPEIFFVHNQFEIDEIIRNHPDVSLIIGSALEREAASYTEAVFIEMTFPVTGRMFLNRAVAGYRGSLSLTEDLYDNL